MLRGFSRARHVVSPSLHQFHSQQRRLLLTLAIETSCDDTCVAILEKSSGQDVTSHDGGTPVTKAVLHFHEKVTAANTGKGGIHPLEALDHHRAQLAKLLQKSLHALPEASPHTPAVKRLPSQDGMIRQIPDFISVTRGPGMRSNLSCGLDTAKGLATAWNIPMVGVHHMQAHALTPRLVSALSSRPNAEDSPAFPFLNLLISGGHTMLLHSHSLTSHKILADTLDTAIGDCLDKCGRDVLPESILSTTTDTSYAKHLSDYAFPDPSSYPTYYPIPTTRSQELAKPANEYGWSIQLPLGNTRQLAFSYAGIPTHVRRLMEARRNHVSDHERRLLARTAMGVAFEHLASRICIALDDLSPPTTANKPPSKPSSQPGIADIKTLVISGGVAANPFLRYFLRAVLDARGHKDLELVFPPAELCTDNAAMIAWAGLEMFEAGWRTDLGVGAVRRWGMDDGDGAGAGDGVVASSSGSSGDGVERGEGGGGRSGQGRYSSEMAVGGKAGMGILGLPGWIKVS